MQNVIQMVFKSLFFLEKSKNCAATEALPSNPRLYKMIELKHLGQLATQLRHFLSEKTLTSKPPPLAKSWLHACLWVCREVA